MEIEDFDYLRESPYGDTKFKVMPLSVAGFNKYRTKDSFTHKYLKTMSHLRFQPNIGLIRLQDNVVKNNELPFVQNVKDDSSIVSKTNIREGIVPNPKKKKENPHFSKIKIQNESNTFNDVNVTENQKPMKSWKHFYTPRAKSNLIYSKSDNTPISHEGKFLNKRLMRTVKGDDNERIKLLLENFKNSKELPLLRGNKLHSVRIEINNNKIMGERYNPYNFIYGYAQSTKGRNSNGALFDH